MLTATIGRAMALQLLDAATSVHAMLEEARAAESLRDFVSKCSISLKECREAYARLRVHESCRIGPPAETEAQGGPEFLILNSQL